MKRNCDICMINEQKAVPAVVDAKTYSGPWAYLCQMHRESDGVGGGLETILANIPD